MQSWLPMLLVATGWLIHLTVSYFLAWVDCTINQAGLLALRHALTAVAVLGTIAIGGLAQRIASISTDGGRPYSEQAMEHSFLMRLTVALSLMFLFAVVMAGASSLFLAPCV